MKNWRLVFISVFFSALFASLLGFAKPMNLANTISANPGVVGTPDPERFSKVYAISDVHGMYDALIPLLQSAGIIDGSNHWSAGDALLLIVGDSIDKGPKSIEVIDFWMNLTDQAAQQGGRVIHLLGNHEAEFLADPANDKKAKELKDELKAKGLAIDQLINPAYPRARFILSEPAAAMIGKWLFCHAGFIEQPTFNAMSTTAMPLLKEGDYSNPFFIGPTSLLEARKWWETDAPTRPQLEARLAASGIFGVVFGHQPSALNVQGAIAQSNDFKLVKIDNGMAPEAGSHPGSVLVFENPIEMNSMSAPHISMIRSGNRTHVNPLPEVPGPSQFNDGDD